MPLDIIITKGSDTPESFLSKVACGSNLRKKLSRIEHVLIVKVLSKEEKLRKFSWYTCKFSFESHFWKRLSKENFLVCHYLKFIRFNPLKCLYFNRLQSYSLGRTTVGPTVNPRMFSVLVIIKIGPTVFCTTHPFTQLPKSCALYSYWTSPGLDNSRMPPAVVLVVLVLITW